MKAVLPNKAERALVEVSKSCMADVLNGRGVLLKIPRVGVAGTDKDINAVE